MSKTQLIAQAAEQLWQAKQKNTVCEPIRTLAGDAEFSLEEAYQIQLLNTQRELAQGRRIIGHKIGLTSKVVQTQLGVDQPDFGCLFDDMIYADGEDVALSSILQPRVEAEMAFVLKRDLNHERNTVVDVLNAIDYVLPAIEIVGSRVRNWDIRLVDTVADNASCGAVVVGSRPVKVDAVDFKQCGMVLAHKGEVVSSGTGALCLGNPLIAAVWLANTMVKMGTPLQAGELVLTGALGAMVSVNEVGVYEANIQGLGSVSVAFV